MINIVGLPAHIKQEPHPHIQQQPPPGWKSSGTTKMGNVRLLGMYLSYAGSSKGTLTKWMLKGVTTPTNPPVACQYYRTLIQIIGDRDQDRWLYPSTCL